MGESTASISKALSAVTRGRFAPPLYPDDLLDDLDNFSQEIKSHTELNIGEPHLVILSSFCPPEYKITRILIQLWRSLNSDDPAIPLTQKVFFLPLTLPSSKSDHDSFFRWTSEQFSNSLRCLSDRFVTFSQ